MENHFDTVAQDWDKNQTHVKRTEAIAEALLNKIEINKGMKALEFGAGTGLLSFALKDHFAEITLMDSSLQMVNVAVEKVVEQGIFHLDPVFFDLEKNDYTDKTFDVIFSQMALHHVENIENIIAKFSKLLNTGGKLVIADLYNEDGTFHDRSFTGHLGFDPDYLSGLLIKQDFLNVKYEPCFVFEKTSEVGVIRNFPIFLMTAEKQKS